jgi:hypothetical protein
MMIHALRKGRVVVNSPLDLATNQHRQRGHDSPDQDGMARAVCGSGIPRANSRSLRGKYKIKHSRQMPQIVGENAGSIRLNIIPLSLASELRHLELKRKIRSKG